MHSIATSLFLQVVFTLIIGLSLAQEGNDHLTPSCAAEESWAISAGAHEAFRTNFHGRMAWRRNYFVVRCFANDFAPTHPDTCDSDNSSVTTAGDANMSPAVVDLHIFPTRDPALEYRMSHVFAGSVTAAMYEIPASWGSGTSWQLTMRPLEPVCDITARVGASVSTGWAFNRGVDVAGLMDVQPGVIVAGHPVTFTFERALTSSVASSDFGDEVVILRDSQTCSTDAPGVRNLFPVVTFHPSNDSTTRPTYSTTMTLLNTGRFTLCSRFQGSSLFFSSASFMVFGGNPLYFRSTLETRGSIPRLRQITLTFFGKQLDPVNDCAVMVRSSEPCTTTRTDARTFGGTTPSCRAGGSPIVRGSADFTSATTGLSTVSWNVTVTYSGYYRVCYRHDGTWEDVLHYDELADQGQAFLNNETDTPIIQHTFTRSMSRSIPEADETQSAIPVPSSTPVPPTTMPPTAAPGYQLCNYTNATTDAVVVFSCPENNTCGDDGAYCISPETDVPTETSAATMPTGSKLCPGGFVCPLDTICGNARCIVTETETAAVLPTPAPTTADPDRVACTAAAGGTVAFFCPAAAPVCCVAMQACCGANHTCRDNVCEPPTTAVPPTPAPTPAPTTTTPPPTPAPVEAPTAPSGFSGFTPSADPVLRLRLDDPTVPASLAANFADLIYAPRSAIVVENTTVDEEGVAEVSIRIDCGPTECDNVARMNYALWRFATSPTDFEAAGIAGVQKEEQSSGASTIRVASASDDGDHSSDAVNTTSLTLIVVGTVVVVALVVAAVLLVRRRQQQQDQSQDRRHNMRFDMEPAAAHSAVDGAVYRTGADVDARGEPYEVAQEDPSIVELERVPNAHDHDTSMGSDAPLEVNDDVDVVVVDVKPPTY